jgi:hypothetical protein
VRDFTYTPHGLRHNRSRIDFFIIGEELINCISKCSIAATTGTLLFDHKAIFLDFRIEKTKSKMYINRSIVTNPRTADVVAAAAADTYLQHAVPGQQPPNVAPRHVFRLVEMDPIEEQKVTVGTLLRSIRSYNDLKSEIVLNSENNLLNLQLAGLNATISELRDQLWDPSDYANLQLTCSDDVFLEVLLSNIKGSVVSFQTWNKRLETCKKSQLIKEINELRSDFLNNSETILEKENNLAALIDKETTAKVRQMKILDCLSSEKPTPMFLSLARCSNSDKKLSAICKPNGDPFESKESRNNFIYNYYRDAYTKDNAEPVDFGNCIERFLGEDVLASPIVQNSKLTNEERAELDTPLTINELDRSMEKANMKSAPGIDGLSNLFLREFWQFIRLPLFKYCNKCLENGRLTQNFRGAAIKLIPKKGEISQLKNWRPISLLSNVYKIISRAINNRLNKIVNRVCSRSQKGFNNCRYTQECLINVIETISYCNDNNIPGAVVAVDMAKAFDTLSHGYLREVFKFFNFGPYLTSWLELIGQNRLACIILDDGSYSKNFDLERGRAQGDNISPNTFNFGEQILLFKIELDPRIRSVREPAPQNNLFNAPNNSFFMFESRRETSKNESLADDNTTITIFDTGCLVALRENLEDFSKFSGLKCNYEKTMVMPVGSAVGQRIDTSGFTVSDQVKLLGLVIKNVNSDFEESFIEIEQKIENLANFWERFRLSLPGRIAVMKTLIIPQINYLGSFLQPNALILTRIQGKIDNFVPKNLNISAERRYLPPELGGLGIFHLETFLSAQKCSWVHRASKLAIDNWRFD